MAEQKALNDFILIALIDMIRQASVHLKHGSMEAAEHRLDLVQYQLARKDINSLD